MHVCPQPKWVIRFPIQKVWEGEREGGRVDREEVVGGGKKNERDGILVWDKMGEKNGEETQGQEKTRV